MFSRKLIMTLAFVVGCGSASLQASPGDMNCDGAVDGVDVASFVLALLDPSGYQATHPECRRQHADLFCDAEINTADISAFVACLLTGDCVECNPLGMAPIPGGSFQMGDAFDEGSFHELPLHSVLLSPYYIDACEVTNQQYAEALNWAYAQGGLITVTDLGVLQPESAGDWHPYCDTATSQTQSRITWDGSTFGAVPGKENHPMILVSWYGAAAYCNWRGAMESRPLCYDVSSWECNFSVSGYRLPTEAEWEKAARGGAGGHRFPWTDAETIQHARANYKSSTLFPYDTSPTRGFHPAFSSGSYPYTSPVAYFAANGYGLYDMAGNAEEWCNDMYSATYYSTSPPSDPTGPTEGWSRLLRGGHWAVNDSCRTAHRDAYGADNRDLITGFRCVVGTP